MTAYNIAYENVKKWRKLSEEKKRAIFHSQIIERVKNSMAMEGEPVSDKWLKKNAR